MAKNSQPRRPGRPRMHRDPVDVTITCERDIRDRLDAIALYLSAQEPGNVSRSAAGERALRAGVSVIERRLAMAESVGVEEFRRRVAELLEEEPSPIVSTEPPIADGPDAGKREDGTSELIDESETP